jgi:hypothetical protein
MANFQLLMDTLKTYLLFMLTGILFVIYHLVPRQSKFRHYDDDYAVLVSAESPKWLKLFLFRGLLHFCKSYRSALLGDLKVVPHPSIALFLMQKRKGNIAQMATGARICSRFSLF